jgi:hypothetical protein
MASENQAHLHNLKDFLRLQTPDVLGLLWINESTSPNQEAPFSWLNYLLNGTLELQVSHHKSDQSCLFVANQFGRNFYLGITSSENMDSFLKQFVQTSKNDKINKLNVISKKGSPINLNELKNKTPYELEFMTY